MLPDPLHPAVVHLPIALAVLVPLLAAGGLLAIRSGFLPARAWLAVALVQALLAGSAALRAWSERSRRSSCSRPRSVPDIWEDSWSTVVARRAPTQSRVADARARIVTAARHLRLFPHRDHSLEAPR